MHLPLPRVCRKLLSCLDIDREKSPKLKEYEHILAAQGPANDKEPQATPPAATLLDFPCYITTGETTPFAELSPDQFRNLFLSIKNSSDITSEHLAAINLDTDIDVVLDELIPKSFADGEPRFLSDSTRELPGEDTEVPFSDRPSRALSNESEAPGRDIYDERLKELSFDNDDAFRAVRRLPALPGRPSTRLAHFRKFWINLDMMSQYWDTSEDNTEPYDEQSHIHHGRRIGTGREMPEQYREDTIKFFVEPIAWKFGCQVRAPTINPRLAVQTILFPVRHSLVVYRMPAERMRTRASNLEGPLIGVQCRPVTKFRNDGQALGEGNAEKVDLLREVSAMLLLAQERARAGKMEMKPGEGKWWTTKPRWGGKAGGESGAATGNSDEATPVRVGRGSRRVPSRRKQEAGRSYQTLSPGPGLWDKKVTYVQVGKNESDNFDDVRSMLR